MANQIRMTPEKMRERAASYSQQGDNVEEVITTMDNLLNELLNEWEGAASEAYEAKYQELKPSFVKMRELIQEISEALIKTADIVEQTDSDIAGQFNS